MAFRHSALPLVLGAAASLALLACKPDDPAGAGGSSSGGSGGQAASTPVVLPPTSNGQSCQPANSSCTDTASIEAYSTCVVKTCDTQYKQCFGADYANGNFGGDCSEWMVCASACQNCDEACTKACTDQHFTGACKACVTGPIFDCVLDAITSKKCTLPCLAPTTGGNCDKLKDCCASLPPDKEPDCTDTYGKVSLGGDQACGSALSVYQQGGTCM